MRLRPVPTTLCSLAVLLASPGALAATLEVGPGKPYAAPCAAIAAAQPNDTITIDAAGSYVGDVCGITKSGLTIKGVGGRPKIDAGGKIAESKGTWVVHANDITIENVELFGAHSANGSSPSDQNGAGIRGQGTNLTVRGCYIHDNDNGILGGGITEGVGDVTIENTEFSHNGFGDGYSHNVYVNHVAKLVFRFNYSHDVAEGHLLKSRADTNVVAYNRLTGEGGTDSYEIDLPNGGIAYVIGNVVQQGKTSHNPGIIAFGEEGPHANGTPDHLFVINNTVVNELGKGTFVLVGGSVATPAVIANNVLFGAGTACSQAAAALSNNVTADPLFVDAPAFDYRVKTGSPCIDAGKDPGVGDGSALAPVFEYVHPAGSTPRAAVGALDVGALEFGNAGGGAGGQGGSGGSGGGAGSGGASGGSAGTSSGGKGGGAGASGGSAGTSGGGAAGGAGTSSGGAAGGAGASSGKGGSAGTSSGKGGNAGGAGTSSGGASGSAGSSSASPAADDAEADDAGGCGCVAVRRPGPWSFALAAISVGLLAARRRRRS